VIGQCKQQISGVLRDIAMLSLGEKQKSSKKKRNIQRLANRVTKEWYKHSSQKPTHEEKVRAKNHAMCRTMVQ